MRVHAAASEPHFADHILPVWLALPKDLRGEFFAARADVAERIRSYGEPAKIRLSVPDDGSAVIVASWGDLKPVKDRDVPIVFMEHGAGLTFGTGHSSYAGGKGKGGVNLFLCPNEQSAAANRKVYHDAAIEVVGCPKLDGTKVRGPAGRTVALSFHWPGKVVPETGWAFPEYRNWLRPLAEKAECEVIGHGHPRAWERLKALYPRLGIEPVAEFSEVLERADLYVHDAGSTLYEFAAAGRPVVAINSRYYRREVHHGLRFWDHIPGPQVNIGSLLAPTVKAMLDGQWKDWEEARESAVRAAYGGWGNDGKASKRAVAAIKRLLR